MAWKKGESGNPTGYKQKPFADALKIEIAQAGGDGKALRRIAFQLIAKAESGDLQAIMAIADRLDGKPAQESTVNVIRRRAEEMSDDELAAIAAGSGEGDTEAPENQGLTH